MKNKELRKSYRKMPCFVCGHIPSDPCHIISYSVCLSDDPVNLIPMCRKHHTEQGMMGWLEFASKYSMQGELLRRGFILDYYHRRIFLNKEVNDESNSKHNSSLEKD